MTNKESPGSTQLLDEIVDTFTVTAKECIEIFFRKQSSPSSPWTVTDDIDCNTDRIITIGCANDGFQAITAIGINHSDCRKLLDQDIHDDGFIYTFGELANTYIALLMDQEAFSKRFGILHQSVPVLYSKGMPFLPFISGISGSITIEQDIMIHFGFSMNHRITGEKKNR
jgi:hypothetical protein